MDKASVRRLQIINILCTQNRWSKIDEIAKEIDCSEKTVRSDIQLLNDILPQGWHIETAKGKGIYIKKPINSSIDQIYSIFNKNSESYQAIKYILIDEITSFTQLKSVLFTQVKSVNSTLERVKNLLKSFNLTLTRNPLQIIGSEIQKRLLGIHVMVGLYSRSNKWPFELYSVQVLKQIIIDATESNNLFLYPSSTFKYIYYIGIMLHRMGKGIPLDIEKSSIFIKNLNESVFNKVANNICDQIEKQYQLTISEDERILLTMVISAFPYITYDELNADVVYLLYHKQANSFYREIYEFVDLLEKKLGIGFHSNKEFIITLKKQFKFLTLFRFFPKRIIVSNPIIDYVQENYFDLYKNVKLVFKEWAKMFAYDDVSNEAIAKIALNIQATIQSQEHISKRVLLLTSEGNGVYRYISTSLKEVFGPKIKFVELKKCGITTKNLHELKVDFIISDFQFEVGNIPVILISFPLTQRDIDQISKYIE